MRLGGPVFDYGGDCDAWIQALQKEGYSAAYSPLSINILKLFPSDETITSFSDASEEADIVISEVGAWSNPIDPNAEHAKAAHERCVRSLALADQIGARCCVNIVGSKSPTRWDGPHSSNFSQDTFDEIVECTRSIVDAAKPKRAYYCLETMPWIFPSTPAQYLSLLQAIDRPLVGVHLDPVNMVSSPALSYDTTSLIRECFATLGPWIRSCHAKDIILRETLTVHLDECCPGSGVLDYTTFLRELSLLDADIPLMMEHMKPQEYPAAAASIRKVAAQANLIFRTSKV